MAAPVRLISLWAALLILSTLVALKGKVCSRSVRVVDAREYTSPLRGVASLQRFWHHSKEHQIDLHTAPEPKRMVSFRALQNSEAPRIVETSTTANGKVKDIESAAIVQVKDAQGLMDAMNQKARHIEIVNHIDLRTLTPQRRNESSYILNDLGSPEEASEDFLWSIQGNCESPPTLKLFRSDRSGEFSVVGAPLVSLFPKKCLIITDGPLVDVKQQLWLNNLVIRSQPSQVPEPAPLISCTSEACNLWMTGVTLQGSDQVERLTGVVSVVGGQAYLEGCIFVDYREVSYMVYASEGATVRFWGGTIMDNTLLPNINSSAILLISALNGDEQIGGALEASQDTFLILEGLRIVSNTAPNDITVLYNQPSSGEEGGLNNQKAAVFSSNEMPVYHALQGQLEATLMPMRLPAGRHGISGNTPWFRNAQSDFSSQLEAGGNGALVRTVPADGARPIPGIRTPSSPAAAQAAGSEISEGGLQSLRAGEFQEHIAQESMTDQAPGSNSISTGPWVITGVAAGVLVLMCAAMFVAFRLGLQMAQTAAVNSRQIDPVSQMGATGAFTPTIATRASLTSDLVCVPVYPPNGPKDGSGESFKVYSMAPIGRNLSLGSSHNSGAITNPLTNPLDAAATARHPCTSGPALSHSDSTSSQTLSCKTGKVMECYMPQTFYGSFTSHMRTHTHGSHAHAHSSPLATPPQLVGSQSVPQCQRSFNSAQCTRSLQGALTGDAGVPWWGAAVSAALSSGGLSGAIADNTDRLPAAQAAAAAASDALGAASPSSSLGSFMSNNYQAACSRPASLAPWLQRQHHYDASVSADLKDCFKGSQDPRNLSADLKDPIHSANALKSSASRISQMAPIFETDTSNVTYSASVLLPPPGPDADPDQRMDFLHQQLDSFDSETPVLDDLVLLGSGDNQRLQGGQAVVQMARSKASGLEYAIKFFVSSTAFAAEHDMYKRGGDTQCSDLAHFLPQVYSIQANEDGALKDTHGHALPPCIVMERGESLDIWAARAKPDRSQAFTMIYQLASRLRDLHALGYVHRDLKPGNVMWLPRENRWTLIDFGCAARTGQPAKLGFSLAYAAPEVVAAFRNGELNVPAQEAVDVWSLGVMAFELLTGTAAVSLFEGRDKVMDRIEGRNGLQLPWEGERLTPANRRKLGVFKSTVTMLLTRDASLRPSMEQFCTTCDRVLGGSTTIQK